MDVPECLLYLEFCLGFVDIDNEFVSLLLKIRSLQSHYITVCIKSKKNLGSVSQFGATVALATVHHVLKGCVAFLLPQ